MEIFIPAGPRLGDKVIVAEHLQKAYDEKLLVEEMNFSYLRGNCGVIGPNGGKTTLFKMITGQEKPNEGTLTLGENVQLGYVDQKRPLDPNKSIWEEISDGQDVLVLGNREVNSRLMLLDLILVVVINRKKPLNSQVESEIAYI